MAVTSRWRQLIEAWQSSVAASPGYCVEQQINVHIQMPKVRFGGFDSGDKHCF